MRISAQLIDISNNSLIWSNQYNRELEDVFSIQDEISLAIVNELRVSLLGEERTELLKHHTENAEVYEAYLKGRHFMSKRTKEGLEKGLDYFRKTVEMDATYALGHAGIADAYNLLAFYNIQPPEEALPKGKEAALRALDIDNTIAEAHASLGWILCQEWDWAGAEREYKRAIELNPGCVNAHHWLSYLYLALTRYDEANRTIEQALKLDPLSPVINREAGLAHLFAGKYDQAIDVLKKTLELDPEFPWVEDYLAFAYVEKAMFEEALAILEEKTFWENAVLARMGEKQKARKWIADNLEELSIRHPIWIAYYYGEAGDADKTFEWLEKAYESHDLYIGWLNARFFLAEYKSDPRYQALLQKIGLTK